MIKIDKFEKIFVANWKLNGSVEFIDKYLALLDPKLSFLKKNLNIICPPSPYFAHLLKNNNNFYVGSQNCSNFLDGQYTGEISAKILKDVGLKFCIVGHSETRSLFNISSEDVSIKCSNLINNDINPIVCIGESLQEKKEGRTKDIIYNQIIKSLPKEANNNSTIIAYEPFWAIGSGLIPSLDEIKSIHDFIKKEVYEFQDFKLLYGGSVKPSNVSDILSINSVDGVLVGGASLDPLDFKRISTT